MKTRWKSLWVILLLMLIPVTVSLAVVGFDDRGNPNDPAVNERANACYEGGSMDGQCDTDWKWEAGWYLIRFQAGLISRDQFPPQYESVLPQEPEIPDTPPAKTNPSGPGCILWTTNYVDFNGGNFLPAGAPMYTDPACTNIDFNWATPLVYTTSGQAAAVALCQANAGMSGAFSQVGNNTIFMCQNL